MNPIEWKNRFLPRDMQTLVNDTVPEMADTQMSRLIQRTADFVKEKLQANDASHDWRHIERVWKLARTIAREEKIPKENLEIVDLAALLHDIDDWKYQEESIEKNRAETFLKSQNVDKKTIEFVLKIIKSIGFKEEIGSKSTTNCIPELACVQDADRLDAIGAIGIARCFTYGGFKKRSLYDEEIPPQTEMTQQMYMNQQRDNTTINHFYEKLLKLSGMMKTNTGKRMAMQRHAFMENFLEQFFIEVSGRG